jgi:BMFP domain-containing protein YqiC
MRLDNLTNVPGQDVISLRHRIEELEDKVNELENRVKSKRKRIRRKSCDVEKRHIVFDI